MATKCSRFLSALPGRLSLLTILPFSLLLYACSPTTLLYDDFNSDQLTGKPTKNIPGSPTGDLVEYAGNVEQRLTIVPFAATSSGKGLAFNGKQLDGDYSSNYLSFKGIQTADFSKDIVCRFIGKFDNFTDGLLLALTNGAALEFTRLNVQQDGALVITTSYASKNGQVTLCVLKPDLNYIFTFTVDMKNKVVNIGILGEVIVNGQPKSGFTGKAPLINNPLEHVTGPINPTIAFQWAETAFGQSKFIMTGLEIRQ